jgi:hypothetical protein
MDLRQYRAARQKTKIDMEIFRIPGSSMVKLDFGGNDYRFLAPVVSID